MCCLVHTVTHRHFLSKSFYVVEYAENPIIEPFTDETQTVLFKDPVRTAQ